MTTLSEMATTISDETRRSTDDDQTAIADMIQQAITFYARRRWWFNEAEGTSFNTASGTEFYALPSELSVIDSVGVTVNQNPYTLNKRTNEYIEDIYTSSSVYTGKPADYAIFKNQIRIWPIPDGTYAVRTQGYGPKSVTVSDDSSPWSNEAYNLIKNRAKAMFLLEWARDVDGYQIYKSREMEELNAMEAENNKRSASKKLRGWGIY